MKKISLIAIATGVALVVVAMVWIGFDWSRIQGDIRDIGRREYTDKRQSFDVAGLKDVKIDLDDVRVEIHTQAEGDQAGQVVVDYFETESDKFNVTGSDGAVTVSRSGEAANHFLCFFRCVGTDRPVIIHVPADSEFAYDLAADNAPVSFDNAGELRAQSIRVVSSNSSVRLQRITASGLIDLRSDNGGIRLRDVSTADRLMLDSSNASNELTGVRAIAITSRTDNGSATLDTVSTDDLTVDTSNASITLKRLAATRSKLTSDNGSVRGSLDGAKEEYRVKIDSSNGSVRVAGERHGEVYSAGDDNAPKSLTVQASNASVDITFER